MEVNHTAPPLPATLGILALCLFGGTCFGQPTVPTAAKPPRALPATDLDGKALDLAARKGWKVIYFWSVDCPCVRDCEQLSLIPLARKYARRVAFYAVAANRLDLAEARADHPNFLGNVETHGLPYAVVLDPKGAVAASLGAAVTPQTFLIDPTGRILFNGSPDDSWTVKNRTGRPGVTQAYLADALDEALSGRAVSRPHVKSLGCGISR